MDEIEKTLCLDRNKLVNVALFLGSDYTIGIKGVGIVNSMEIISCFQDLEALRRFRAWAERADILLDNVEEHYKNIPAVEK